MKPSRHLSLSACLLAFAVSAPAADSPAGPVPIFNGRDLTGWRVPAPNPFWKVVDGVLVGENDPALTGHVLRTERDYHDFVLEFEARWSGGADSGIIFRHPDLQVQLGVSASRKIDLTGSFYTGGKERYPEAGLAPKAGSLLRPDGWNQFRIEARGDTFTVWLNGEQIARYVNAGFAAPAPIGLQLHPKNRMKAEFRHLRALALD